jgi:CoA-transferase family III
VGNWQRIHVGLPPSTANGRPLFHAALNAGKTICRLDLKADEGRSALLSLAAQADALIEGFRPGVMQRLGLGPETMRAENPRLITIATLPVTGAVVMVGMTGQRSAPGRVCTGGLGQAARPCARFFSAMASAAARAVGSARSTAEACKACADNSSSGRARWK